MSKTTAIEATNDFLTGLFDRMQLSVKVESEEADGDVVARITGKLGKLRDAEVAAAISQLTSSAVSGVMESRVRCTLDVGGDLEERKQLLSAAVVEIADMVARTGKRAVLDNLSPLERRLAHTAIMEDDEVGSRSVGEGEPRTLLLEPAKG